METHTVYTVYIIHIQLVKVKKKKEVFPSESEDGVGGKGLKPIEFFVEFLIPDLKVGAIARCLLRVKMLADAHRELCSRCVLQTSSGRECEINSSK